MFFKLFCKYFSLINLHGQTIILDCFCAAIKIIPDRASVDTQGRLWRRDLCDGGGVASRRSQKWGVTYRMLFVPHFGAGLVPSRAVATIVDTFSWRLEKMSWNP